MDEIKRRAMFGDKEAQWEITQREELLPCPCCGNERIVMVGKDNGYYYECCNCGLRSKSSTFNIDYIRMLWNTRIKI